MGDSILVQSTSAGSGTLKFAYLTGSNANLNNKPTITASDVASAGFAVFCYMANELFNGYPTAAGAYLIGTGSASGKLTSIGNFYTITIRTSLSSGTLTSTVTASVGGAPGIFAVAWD